MKKLKKCTTALLVGLTVSIVAAPQAMAANTSSANTSVDTNTAIAQLRMEDKGPDLSKGILVEEFWGMEEDGTPYVERTYVSNEAATLRAAGAKTYTKTKSYGSTGSLEVTGKFEYDSVAQTVYVLSEDGRYNSGGGISDYEDLGTTTSGEGSSKATVKYSCKVNRNLGGWATYSVSVSCNYLGNKS